MATVIEPLRVVELYAGTARSIEPFRGWPRATVSLLVDSNKLAQTTYQQNYPKAPYIAKSLRRTRPDEIETLAGGKVDVLLGCPPCQGFSDTGSRDLSDPNNEHLWRFGVMAEGLMPRAIAMENVPIAAKTRRFQLFTERLERAGYRWTARILNAALWGSTQCRQRLIFVALHEDVGIDPVLPEPTHGASGTYFCYGRQRMMTAAKSPRSILGEAPATGHISRDLAPNEELRLGPATIPSIAAALDGLPRIGTPAANQLGHVQWNHGAKMLRRMGAVPEGGRWKGGEDHFSHAYGRLHRRGLGRTITTYFSNPGSGRFWHPTENRALTAREAARLQGFPDSFGFPDVAGRVNSVSKLIGNALDQRLGNVAFEVIRSALE